MQQPPPTLTNHEGDQDSSNRLFSSARVLPMKSLAAPTNTPSHRLSIASTSKQKSTRPDWNGNGRLMTNPIADLLALRRAPAALATDLNTIAQAMRSVSAIETMLASLLSALDPC